MASSPSPSISSDEALPVDLAAGGLDGAAIGLSDSARAPRAPPPADGLVEDATAAWVLRGRRHMLASLGVKELDSAAAIASALGGRDGMRKRMRELLGGPPGVVFVSPRVLVTTPAYWLHSAAHVRGARGGDVAVSGVVNPVLAARQARSSLPPPGSAAAAAAAGAGASASAAAAQSGVPSAPPETFSTKRYAANTRFVPLDQVSTWRRWLQTPPRSRSPADLASLDSACLSRVGAFTDVPQSLRLFMLRHATYTHIPAGETLFAQNDAADSVYVVLSGFAQVIVDLSAVPIHDIEMSDLKRYDQVNEQGAINTVGPLESFGEKALQQLFGAMMESWGGAAGATTHLKRRGRRFSHTGFSADAAAAAAAAAAATAAAAAVGDGDAMPAAEVPRLRLPAGAEAPAGSGSGAAEPAGGSRNRSRSRRVESSQAFFPDDDDAGGPAGDTSLPGARGRRRQSESSLVSTTSEIDSETAALLPPADVRASWAYRRLIYLLKRTVESSDIAADGSLPGYALTSPKALASPAARASPAASPAAVAAEPSLPTPASMLRQQSLLYAPTSPRAMNVQKALEQLIDPPDGSPAMEIRGGRRLATVKAAADTDLHLMRIPLVPFLYLLARNRREVQDVATVVLKQTELFGGWPERALTRIAITAQRRTYRPGDTIAQQGNPAIGVFVVLVGHCRVLRSMAVSSEVHAAVTTALTSHAGESLAPTSATMAAVTANAEGSASARLAAADEAGSDRERTARSMAAGSAVAPTARSSVAVLATARQGITLSSPPSVLAMGRSPRPTNTDRSGSSRPSVARRPSFAGGSGAGAAHDPDTTAVQAQLDALAAARRDRFSAIVASHDPAVAAAIAGSSSTASLAGATRGGGERRRRLSHVSLHSVSHASVATTDRGQVYESGGLPAPAGADAAAAPRPLPPVRAAALAADTGVDTPVSVDIAPPPAEVVSERSDGSDGVASGAAAASRPTIARGRGTLQRRAGPGVHGVPSRRGPAPRVSDAGATMTGGGGRRFVAAGPDATAASALQPQRPRGPRLPPMSPMRVPPITPPESQRTHSEQQGGDGIFGVQTARTVDSGSRSSPQSSLESVGARYRSSTKHHDAASVDYTSGRPPLTSPLRAGAAAATGIATSPQARSVPALTLSPPRGGGATAASKGHGKAAGGPGGAAAGDRVGFAAGVTSGDAAAASAGWADDRGRRKWRGGHTVIVDIMRLRKRDVFGFADCILGTDLEGEYAQTGAAGVSAGSLGAAVGGGAHVAGGGAGDRSPSVLAGFRLEAGGGQVDPAHAASASAHMAVLGVPARMGGRYRTEVRARREREKRRSSAASVASAAARQAMGEIERAQRGVADGRASGRRHSSDSRAGLAITERRRWSSGDTGIPAPAPSPHPSTSHTSRRGSTRGGSGSGSGTAMSDGGASTADPAAFIPRRHRRRSSLTAFISAAVDADKLGLGAGGRRPSIADGGARRGSLSLEAQTRATIAAPHSWSQTLVAETRVEAIFIPRTPALLDICLSDAILTQQTWERAVESIPTDDEVAVTITQSVEWAQYKRAVMDDATREAAWSHELAHATQRMPFGPHPSGSSFAASDGSGAVLVAPAVWSSHASLPRPPPPLRSPRNASGEQLPATAGAGGSSATLHSQSMPGGGAPIVPLAAAPGESASHMQALRRLQSQRSYHHPSVPERVFTDAGQEAGFHAYTADLVASSFERHFGGVPDAAGTTAAGAAGGEDKMRGSSPRLAPAASTGSARTKRSSAITAPHMKTAEDLLGMQTPIYRFALLPEAADVALANVRRYEEAADLGLVLPNRSYTLSLNPHASTSPGGGAASAAVAGAPSDATLPRFGAAASMHLARTTSFASTAGAAGVGAASKSASVAMLGFASPGGAPLSPKMGGYGGVTHYPSVVSIATTTTGAWPPASAATLPTIPSDEMLRALLLPIRTRKVPFRHLPLDEAAAAAPDSSTLTENGQAATAAIGPAPPPSSPTRPAPFASAPDAGTTAGAPMRPTRPAAPPSDGGARPARRPLSLRVGAHNDRTTTAVPTPSGGPSAGILAAQRTPISHAASALPHSGPMSQRSDGTHATGGASAGHEAAAGGVRRGSSLSVARRSSNAHLRTSSAHRQGNGGARSPRGGVRAASLRLGQQRPRARRISSQANDELRARLARFADSLVIPTTPLSPTHGGGAVHPLSPSRLAKRTRGTEASDERIATPHASPRSVHGHAPGLSVRAGAAAAGAGVPAMNPKHSTSFFGSPHGDRSSPREIGGGNLPAADSAATAGTLGVAVPRRPVPRLHLPSASPLATTIAPPHPSHGGSGVGEAVSGAGRGAPPVIALASPQTVPAAVGEREAQGRLPRDSPHKIVTLTAAGRRAAAAAAAPAFRRQSLLQADALIGKTLGRGYKATIDRWIEEVRDDAVVDAPSPPLSPTRAAPGSQLRTLSPGKMRRTSSTGARGGAAAGSGGLSLTARSTSSRPAAAASSGRQAAPLLASGAIIVGGRTGSGPKIGGAPAPGGAAATDGRTTFDAAHAPGGLTARVPSLHLERFTLPRVLQTIYRSNAGGTGGASGPAGGGDASPRDGGGSIGSGGGRASPASPPHRRSSAGAAAAYIVPAIGKMRLPPQDETPLQAALAAALERQSDPVKGLRAPFHQLPMTSLVLAVHDSAAQRLLDRWDMAQAEALRAKREAKERVAAHGHGHGHGHAGGSPARRRSFLAVATAVGRTALALGGGAGAGTAAAAAGAAAAGK